MHKEVWNIVAQLYLLLTNACAKRFHCVLITLMTNLLNVFCGLNMDYLVLEYYQYYIIIMIQENCAERH